MTLRIFRIITLTIVSHLLIAPLAFTSQLPAQSSSGETAVPALAQDVTMKALQQEKQGDVYKLDGDVEILFQSYTLRAEHGTYNDADGEVEVRGRVVFDGGPHDTHITASRATYNVKNETGSFYDVLGTFGAVVRGQAVVLTTSNPFVIVGREVRKVGRNRYVVMHGSITSCAEEVPTWTFNAEKIDLVTGEDAKLYHSTFRLLKLPIFYFPYNKLPVNAMARTSGFMLPNVGQSSTKGYILGDSAYWAINRSSDVTLGMEYFSRRGWSETMQFRAKPGENTSLEMHIFAVQDRGAPVTKQDQGGEEIRLIGDTTRGHWRAAESIDYLSSFLFRQAFSETFSQAVNSEVRSSAYVSHNLGGFSLNASTGRYQNFYQDPTTKPVSFSNQIKILHLPMMELNGLEQHVFSSPLLWAVDASGGGVQRSEPRFVTANLVGRLNIRPQIALPLQWNGWVLRSEIALDDTLYTQEVTPSASNPLGVATGHEVNRRDVATAIELRPPALQRVFDKEIFGRRLKHVIEPIFTYRFTSGIGNFQNIIRFDQADIVSNTSEVEYDIIQRIYGRRRPSNHEPGCEALPLPSTGRKGKVPSYIPGVSALGPRCEDEGKTTRELLSWEVKQKYYIDPNFGGALVPGRRNVLANTVDLTGIAFLDRARNWSPVVSKLRLQTSANTDVQWQLDYDPVRGRINSSAVFVEYRFGEYFAGLSNAFFHVPAEPAAETFASAPLVFNQFRYLLGYGHPNKRGFAGGFSISYDENLNFLQYAAGQSSYNWNCCGLSFEYRHVNVPGVNVENQYRFAFTLANIGTFGNMRRQERLY